ncbi:DUF6163 family protein [Enterovirga sp.]|jgi:hypothetical protein|uniref:DUF6163 family protein n=1 Tax=Enterovirga sp. TaxID=2026350 RepID=UPI002610E613|nr:DUF6163 family protein [Enterovirga sp.]MDB5589988.1 hypothetical protein [Enterovirga sp.]
MIGARSDGARASRGSGPDEILREREPSGGVSWNRILVWFMRALALAWLMKGLLAWAVIMGITSQSPSFQDASTGFQAAIIYFALIDLVAAVGLWLTSNWGGVLWLLAVMSHLILAVFFPRFVSNSALVVALFITCIMVYLVLSWLAAVEE